MSTRNFNQKAEYLCQKTKQISYGLSFKFCI